MVCEYPDSPTQQQAPPEKDAPFTAPKVVFEFPDRESMAAHVRGTANKLPRYYRAHPQRAVQIQENCRINSPEGQVEVAKGDWLVETPILSDDGSHKLVWLHVTERAFKFHYEPLPRRNPPREKIEEFRGPDHFVAIEIEVYERVLKRLALAESELGARFGERKNLMHELRAANDSCDNFRNENHKLSEDIRTASAACDNLRSENTRLQKMLDQVKCDLYSLGRAYANLAAGLK